MSKKILIAGVIGSLFLLSGQVMAKPEQHANANKHKPQLSQQKHQSGQQGQKIIKRMQHQKRLINKGARSGKLTKRESKKLRAEQRRIKNSFRKMKRNGLSGQEKRKLSKMLNRAKRNINKESRDSQRVQVAKHNKHGR
ncbi:MAG: Unknown protein [uncultured Thiotrichaceae bacterium]|uniref:Uncharacterized protein n=1 Tax=uncultured Thiotrichaceae bacterium TaxID=298394 RepID=A0A6S6TYY8_9GAMM|nr:MAG: Unknown protein [uncultured Thiotrichaceae bacterium]